MTGWSNSIYHTPNNTHKYAIQALVEVARGLNPNVIRNRDIAYVVTDRLERARKQ